MKISVEQTAFIKKTFPSMRTKEDFLELLNYAKNIIYGDKSHSLLLRQLNFYINSRTNKSRYRSFTIKKSNGKNRIIHAPVAGLKVIQKCLNLILQEIYEPGIMATGFVRGRSVVDNAGVHKGQNYVFNIDLKDFFPSIEQGRIWGRLKLAPFLLNEKRKNVEIANIISVLCTQEMEVERISNEEKIKIKRNVLPQGAPTSPILSNAICQQLDFYLSAVARRFGLKYTRYADDITFSSMHNVYQSNGEFMVELERIICKQGFTINANKTRLQKTGFRQEVTGLVVNREVNVVKSYQKQLRVWLKTWESKGYEEASKIFLSSEIENRAYCKPKGRLFSKVIEGKLNYLMMVKGKHNAMYLKLHSRFKELENNLQSTNNSANLPAMESNEVDDQVLRVRLEISKGKLLKGTLKHTINIPKDTTVPNTIVFKNFLEKGSHSPPKLHQHNPIYTVSFLKMFKTGDGSGFKELVHDTDLNHFGINEIVNTVKSHPNFYYNYNNQYLHEVSFLNGGIQNEIINLIDLFDSQGKKYFSVTGKHPFNNDQDYTAFAKKFKKKYRYGSGSEYGNLREDLLKLLTATGLSKYAIVFLPDERKFDIRATFYTWQPSIYHGLKYLLSGIIDHSNIGGSKSFKNEDKIIEFGASRITQDEKTFVEFTIFDKGSLAMIDSMNLRDYLKKSLAFKHQFRYLCDWSVKCDFSDEPSQAFHILVQDAMPDDAIRVEELDEKVGGFKHILKFYDNI